MLEDIKNVWGFEILELLIMMFFDVFRPEFFLYV